MNKKVTQEEWQKFKARQLSPEEMADVSRRMKEHGLEQPAAKSAVDVLLKLAPIETTDDTLGDVAAGRADEDVRKMVEEARAVDPGMDRRMAAIESAQRQVAASVSMRREAAPARPRGFLSLVTASGWLATAACLGAMALVVTQKDKRLSDLDTRVRDTETQLSLLKGGSLFGPGANFGEGYRSVPEGSAYTRTGDGYTYQFTVAAPGRTALDSGTVGWNDFARSGLGEMRETLASGVSLSPGRTFVDPGSVKDLVVTGAKVEEAELKDPDGTVVAVTPGPGGKLSASTAFAKPGKWSWKATIVTADGVRRTVSTDFGVVTPEYAKTARDEASKVADPVSVAAVLAQHGYRQQAEQILAALTRQSRDAKIERVLEAVKKGP